MGIHFGGGGAAASSSPNTSITIAQAGHGFGRFDVVRLDPDDGWVKASSTSAELAGGGARTGVVARAIGADSFELQVAGLIEGDHGLPAGVAWLGVDGALAAIPPADSGHVALPIGEAWPAGIFVRIGSGWTI